jgi:hypothetical protein
VVLYVDTIGIAKQKLEINVKGIAAMYFVFIALEWHGLKT